MIRYFVMASLLVSLALPVRIASAQSYPANRPQGIRGFFQKLKFPFFGRKKKETSPTTQQTYTDPYGRNYQNQTVNQYGNQAANYGQAGSYGNNGTYTRTNDYGQSGSYGQTGSYGNNGNYTRTNDYGRSGSYGQTGNYAGYGQQSPQNTFGRTTANTTGTRYSAQTPVKNPGYHQNTTGSRPPTGWNRQSYGTKPPINDPNTRQAEFRTENFGRQDNRFSSRGNVPGRVSSWGNNARTGSYSSQPTQKSNSFSLPSNFRNQSDRTKQQYSSNPTTSFGQSSRNSYDRLPSTTLTPSLSTAKNGFRHSRGYQSQAGSQPSTWGNTGRTSISDPPYSRR